MKRKFLSLMALPILLGYMSNIRPEIVEIKQVPQMKHEKNSMSDVVVKFIYNHSFLCFVGLWLYSENIVKAFIGMLIAKGLSHEYLDMYHVPHGFCPKQLDLLFKEIINNDETIIITDSVSIIV